VNLRGPTVVDRSSAAEHQYRRDERIHHRDIATAVTQQAMKTECRHGGKPTVVETRESACDRAPRVKTVGIKQRPGLCTSNVFRTICPNAKVFLSGALAFSRLSARFNP